MTGMDFVLYILVFLYGIVIGSFLNVCIYRLPKDESVVVVSSHCMSCHHKLKWYDLFPLFSWLFLRGKCRYCGAKISVQYPIVEAVNGILYVLIFAMKGFGVDAVLLCLVTSALIVISVIDYRTMLIPVATYIIILLMGIIQFVYHFIVTENYNWSYYVIGFFFTGGFLLVIALLFKGITGKGGLGLGDIEFMACAGLFLGWGHGLFAIIIGSVAGILIECVKMAIKKERGKFPFGPYLSAGVLIAALWGDTLLEMYKKMIGM